MASKLTSQTTAPVHIENSVNSLQQAELRLPKAFTTYRSMLENPQIGAGLGLIQNMINKLEFGLECHKDAGTEETKLVTALNKSLTQLEGMTKVDFLNYILSMCSYGNSIFEMVLDRVDGKMVFKTFVPIHPINVNKYVFKRNKLTRLELSPPENDGVLIQQDSSEKIIQGDKVIMFALNKDLDHPLGRSILNRCYAPWRKHSIVDEYETIACMKDLSGVLKLTAPAEYINDYLNNPNSDNAKYVEELFQQAEDIHSGRSAYAVVASDTNTNGVKMFDIETLGNKSGNGVDADIILKRLENNILITLYADILSLGQGSGGSFALSDSKTTLLALFIDSLLHTITESFQKAVDAVYLLNGVKAKAYPAKLKFEGVEALDFESFSRGFQRLIDADVIQSDDELEEWVRNKIKAPLKGKTPRLVEVKPMVDTDRKEKEL